MRARLVVVVVEEKEAEEETRWMWRDSFDVSMANVLLPSVILVMMFGGCANQCMAFAQLPSSLLGMTGGD